MGGLITLYIAATVFGVGVTLVDLLGIFGHSIGHGAAQGGHGGAHDAAGDQGGARDTGDHGGGDHTGDTGHHDAGDHSGAVHDTSHDLVHHAPGPQEPSVVGHERRTQRYIGLKTLTTLRSLVYFSFGFGPIGWIAAAMSHSPLESLLWSVPAGLLFAASGIALRRIQRSVLDSQIRDDELLMEKAEVIVPIEAGQMGKVRAVVNGLYVERFARAKEPGDSYATGSVVRIVTISEDFVVVSDV